MAVALKENPDCKAFVTDCYWRNNSQYFFNKLGATSVGFCNIPDIYLDDQMERKIQNIVGEVMFWSREKVDEFLKTTAIEKGKNLADIPYSRNTQEYSLMTAAEGDLKTFEILKKQNIGYWTRFIAQKRDTLSLENTIVE